MPAPRIAVVALLAPLSAGLAAACGGEPGTSPRERIEAADEATVEAGTAAFSLESRVRTGPDTLPGSWTTFTAGGAIDLRTGASRIRTELGPGISLTVLNDGDTLYIRMPAMMAGGDGARWIRQPVSGTGAFGAGAAGLARTTLPFLSALDSVPGEIHPVGADTVRGTPVDGFEFTVPGSRFWPAEAPVSTPTDSLRIPMTVWIDPGNRVHRMSVEMELTPMLSTLSGMAGDSLPPQSRRALEAMGRRPSGRVEVTAELFDFGAEVVTRPPDTATVIDADAPARELGRPGTESAGAPSSASDSSAAGETAGESGSTGR